MTWGIPRDSRENFIHDCIHLNIKRKQKYIKNIDVNNILATVEEKIISISTEVWRVIDNQLKAFL